MRIHDSLEYYARIRPDLLFAEQGGRSLDFAQADAEANRLAHALLDAGLGKGDRFAHLSKNSIEQAIMFFAASKVGAVPVPLNYRLAAPEWAFIINDSQSRLLIAQGSFAGMIEGVRDRLESTELLISIGEQPADGWTDYEHWLDGQETTAPDIEVDDADVVYQMYTSGTTGLPKGAMLTHRAVEANLLQAMAALAHNRPITGQRTLLVAPMYHAAGGMTMIGAVSGGVGLVIHQDFDPLAVVEALSEGGVHYVTLVPAMIQACLVAVPDIAERNFDQLRYIAYGASPIAEETLRRAMEVFQCDFYQGYGMTETTAVLTYLDEEDHRRALSGDPELLLSAGRAIAGTDLRVVDADDNPVAPGTVGEIIARGPQIMNGYWNRSEASEEALRGGFMHTGDAATMDERGYVFIQDRIKDMIVSGGENVYPREVENALFEHPQVVDAAVIGVPDERWGETVLAVLVLRGEADVSEEEIIAFCRERIAGYKVPRRIELRDELPRNASGKVLKTELREPYWKDHDRRVG